MKENQEYAIWKVMGSPEYYAGGEVEEVLKNGRVSLKSALKDKPVMHYHSLHSLGEGREIMNRIKELATECREKQQEIGESTKKAIEKLVNGD